MRYWLDLIDRMAVRPQIRRQQMRRSHWGSAGHWRDFQRRNLAFVAALRLIPAVVRARKPSLLAPRAKPHAGIEIMKVRPTPGRKAIGHADVGAMLTICALGRLTGRAYIMIAPARYDCHRCLGDDNRHNTAGERDIRISASQAADRFRGRQRQQRHFDRSSGTPGRDECITAWKINNGERR